MLSMVSNTEFLPFQFEGMALKESCWMEGKPYFTYRAIGEFLEYEYPDRSIHNLIERNPHILTFSSLIKLVSELDTGKGTKYEREKETRVVDPIGLQLIINKSNQPKAIAFQVAAAHLVYAFMTGDLKPSKWSQRGDLVSAARQILSLPEGRKRKQVIVDLAEREGLSLQQTYRRITMVTGERLKGKTGKPKKSPSFKGKHTMPDEVQKIIDTANTNPGLTKKDIYKLSGTKYSYGHVNMILRGQKTVH